MHRDLSESPVHLRRCQYAHRAERPAERQLSDGKPEIPGDKDVPVQDRTPARIDRNSIDFSRMEEQKGDERVVPFSFTTDPEDVQIDQVSCWLTYTNETTHEIIRNNLDRSPLFSRRDRRDRSPVLSVHRG